MSSDKTQNTGMRGKSADAGGDLGVHSQIGRKLKQYYDDLVSDEVPDKFMELLTRLDKGEAEPRKPKD